MFDELQSYFNDFIQGPIQLEQQQIFNIPDVDSLYNQILNQIEAFDEEFLKIQDTSVNEPAEEQFVNEEQQNEQSVEIGEEEFGAEEENLESNFNAFDPNNNQNEAALALEMGESESESEVQLTPYQESRQKLIKLISQTEEALVAPKDWKFSGEVTSAQRPEDALLHDMPEFDVKRKLPLEIDAQINAQIEELIKLRILDKKFDNPVYIQNIMEKEKEKVSFSKSAKALGDVIDIEVQGQRVELTAAIKELRNEVKQAVQELEAELRSYFVQYMIVK
ncbi:U3 small nucleolar ribonucleoprotein MPP10 [Spironucleus salmonicida]|uniref:U3 small nucleolar ribonucleoprotein MPP10 n=1 Tax=Spironucleus salmonicida TaxID=348837 RepID=V6LHX0_9EUKA|nr:U3 small nucleolar ribonucleoprotein MPP10 [Spironucleus salmonicida]|eukprot:EST43913.1 U3 small nucleolar ribonucleoprotein MPP10 [Spironucleus salmonicida]